MFRHGILGGLNALIRILKIQRSRALQANLVREGNIF